MTAINISSKVNQDDWKNLQNLECESHQSISGLLTEAIRTYVHKKRLRPAILKHLDDSIIENKDLGRRLAK